MRIVAFFAAKLAAIDKIEDADGFATTQQSPITQRIERKIQTLTVDLEYSIHREHG